MKNIALLAACILAASAAIANDKTKTGPKPKPNPCIVGECPEPLKPKQLQQTLIPNGEVIKPKFEGMGQGLDIKQIPQRGT